MLWGWKATISGAKFIAFIWGACWLACLFWKRIIAINRDGRTDKRVAIRLFGRELNDPNIPLPFKRVALAIG